MLPLKPQPYLYLICMLFLAGCTSKEKQKTATIVVKKEKTATPKDSLFTATKKKENTDVVLTEKNAIAFLFDYQKKHKENKVRISTKYGDIDILLFDKTPYHRANFIYLTKKKYFDNTLFYRVVPDFIIQGGNSDDYKISKKRAAIGKYLLPPDTKKGYKHHRGTVSMPSSAIANPHKLASPFEFFIVQKNPGSYHLDGKYTAFGKVIKGMDVVDQINKLPTDTSEWPIENVRMRVSLLE